MSKSIIALAVAILIAAILLAGSMIYSSMYDRYYIFKPSNDSPYITFDKKTGTYYYYQDNKFREVNYINHVLK